MASPRSPEGPAKNGGMYSPSHRCSKRHLPFKIYDAVPLERSISYAEIAAKVGLPEYRVRTVIRSAIIENIFAKPTLNQVVHTPSSALLRRDQVLLDWYGHLLDDIFTWSPKLADALK